MRYILFKEKTLRFCVCSAVVFLLVGLSGCDFGTYQSRVEERDQQLRAGITNASGMDMETEAIQKDLQVLGAVFIRYYENYKQGPANWQGFVVYAGGDGPALQELRKLGYEVSWGATLPQGADASTVVIAQSPNHSLKCYLDGSVR
jgi:hypothetical protein